MAYRALSKSVGSVLVLERSRCACVLFLPIKRTGSQSVLCINKTRSSVLRGPQLLLKTSVSLFSPPMIFFHIPLFTTPAQFPVGARATPTISNLHFKCFWHTQEYLKNMRERQTTLCFVSRISHPKHFSLTPHHDIATCNIFI